MKKLDEKVIMTVNEAIEFFGISKGIVKNYNTLINLFGKEQAFKGWKYSENWEKELDSLTEIYNAEVDGDVVIKLYNDSSVELDNK